MAEEQMVTVFYTAEGEVECYQQHPADSPAEKPEPRLNKAKDGLQEFLSVELTGFEVSGFNMMMGTAAKGGKLTIDLATKKLSII